VLRIVRRKFSRFPFATLAPSIHSRYIEAAQRFTSVARGACRVNLARESCTSVGALQGNEGNR
jgi:hypothetical protein